MKTIRLSEARVGDRVHIVPRNPTPAFDFTITHVKFEGEERSLYSSYSQFWLGPKWGDVKVKLISRRRAWWLE